MRQLKINLVSINKKKYELLATFSISLVVIFITLYNTLPPIWLGLTNLHVGHSGFSNLSTDVFTPVTAQYYVGYARGRLNELLASELNKSDTLKKWFKPAHLGGGGNITITAVSDSEIIIKIYSRDIAMLRALSTQVSDLIIDKSNADAMKYKILISEQITKEIFALKLLDEAVGVIEKTLVNATNYYSEESVNLISGSEIKNITEVIDNLIKIKREINLLNISLFKLNVSLEIINDSLETNSSTPKLELYQTYPRKILILIYGLVGAMLCVAIHSFCIGIASKK